MTTTRKQYSPRFKARVAMEAMGGEKPLSQLGSQCKVHPMQIAKWRKAAIDQLPELFVDGRTRKGASEVAETDALYQEIGRLKVELDWLRKKSACYQPRGESEGSLTLMRLIDEEYMRYRFFGSRRLRE